MDTIELRKIQEMGGGTALVSLPKNWVRKNNLKRGSIISLERISDDKLIISPYVSDRREAKEVVLEYPPSHLHNLLNEITAAYLLGYDVIKIVGKDRVSYTDRDTIKGAMKFLMGLEIVEEDAYSITIQFLLDPTNLHPDKLFMRMHAITLGMHKDLLAACVENDRKLLKDIRGRDDEVDRLYFLLVRIIRSAVLDASLAAKFKMTAIECLDYRVAANLLESIGDTASEIAAEVEEKQPNFSKEAKRGFLELERVFNEIQDCAVRALLTKRASEARKVLELFEELSTKLARQPDSILSRMNNIAKLCVDIADLAVPLYPTVR